MGLEGVESMDSGFRAVPAWDRGHEYTLRHHVCNGKKYSRVENSGKYDETFGGDTLQCADRRVLDSSVAANDFTRVNMDSTCNVII